VAAGSGQNRPTCSALGCLLPPGADMVREKAPLLGRNFRFDTRRLRQTGQHAISSPIPAIAGRRLGPLHDLPTSALPDDSTDPEPLPLNERPLAGPGPGSRPVSKTPAADMSWHAPCPQDGAATVFGSAVSGIQRAKTARATAAAAPAARNAALYPK
jgi:hypothetical protein